MSKMNKVRRIIYKFLRWKGFSIRINRTPVTKESFIKMIDQEEPLTLKTILFKKYAAYFRHTHNTQLYEEVLQYYVPNWEKIYSKAVFMNVPGGGRDNLNVYRKVKINGEYYVEKVYFTHLGYISIHSSNWFFKNAYPLIQKHIKTAEISYSFSSDFLTILYYKFIEIPHNEKEKDKAIINISKYLYEASFDNTIETLIKVAPKFLKINNLSLMLIQYESIIKSYLLNQNIKVNLIEASIQTNRKVLTHGDLNPSNLISSNVIIDWDTFGLRPAGYEVAYIFWKFLISDFIQEEVYALDWLKKEYKDTIIAEEWELFELTFVYYAFIFIYGAHAQTRFTTIQKELLAYLKEI